MPSSTTDILFQKYACDDIKNERPITKNNLTVTEANLGHTITSDFSSVFAASVSRRASSVSKEV